MKKIKHKEFSFRLTPKILIYPKLKFLLSFQEKLYICSKYFKDCKVELFKNSYIGAKLFFSGKKQAEFLVTISCLHVYTNIHGLNCPNGNGTFPVKHTLFSQCLKECLKNCPNNYALEKTRNRSAVALQYYP